MEETINNKAKKETCNYLRETRRASDCGTDDVTTGGNNGSNNNGNSGICAN